MTSILQFAGARANFEMAHADLESLPADYENIECDYLVGITLEALDSMLLCPAPDLAALAYKMETFAAQDCFGFSPHIRDPLFAALQADVARLARTCGGST
jgi:hypothetical protein